jgi:hypothetical protein
MLSKVQDKKVKKKASKLKGNHKVKDYGNDPFFVKKAEESKAFLESNGFPTGLVNKK